MKTACSLLGETTRRAPRVYVVQTLDFNLLPVTVTPGEKPFRMQRVGKTQVLQILAGPLFYDTREQQLAAMEIALANKSRWPVEFIKGEEAYSLGPVMEQKERVATPYDDLCEDF